MMVFAYSIVWLVAIYAIIGLLFGLTFVTWGVSRIDPSARGTGVGFRLMILPGVIAFWPLLARRWLQEMKEPPVERNAHRSFASTKPGER
ncbi:MAG: hypothetical protein MOB07_14220 [Acidobacteria bacterium]|nr:hypothetical protein [Acidobacteriota bacterium]